MIDSRPRINKIDGKKHRTLQYFVALLTLYLIREKKLDWCTEKFPYQRNTWILKYEYRIYIHVKIQPNYAWIILNPKYITLLFSFCPTLCPHSQVI